MISSFQFFYRYLTYKTVLNPPTNVNKKFEKVWLPSEVLLTEHTIGIFVLSLMYLQNVAYNKTFYVAICVSVHLH